MLQLTWSLHVWLTVTQLLELPDRHLLNSLFTQASLLSV